LVSMKDETSKRPIWFPDQRKVERYFWRRPLLPTACRPTLGRLLSG
jgi:hypothetical protein